MRRVGFVMEDELHKKLRIYAATHDMTMTQAITEFIKHGLETKKEQSR